MGTVKVPILAIYSDKDQVIPFDDSRIRYETIRNLSSKNEFCAGRG